MISLLFALSSPARADDVGTSVFVSQFQARNNEAQALAELLPRFLESQLQGAAGLHVVPLADVGAVHDTPAELYLQSCPAGEYVGCAFVVGEAAAAQYAVTGTVQALVSGTRVDVSIVDVLASEEVVSFQVELGSGDDEVFADKVAAVLVGVIKGEVGRKQDIRDGEATDEAALEARRLLLSQLLDELSQELGDVSTMTHSTHRVVEPPKFTMDDLADRMETEGVKPWEQLQMSPQGYMRFKNSGMVLRDWKVRAAGRQGQLLLRPMIGFVRAPIMGEYFARFARQASDTGFSVAESYSYQATTAGSGAWVGGNVGYGILPELELGVEAGLAFGRYTVLIQSETVGETPNVTQPQEYASRLFFVGPRAIFAPFPTKNIRPVLGASATWWRGSAVDDHIAPPEETAIFGAPTMWLVTAMPGVEARMSQNLDLYLHVPLSAVVAGGEAETSRTGSGAFDSVEDPPDFAPFAAGLLVGFQVRLFGRDVDGDSPEDALEDMDEPEI